MEVVLHVMEYIALLIGILAVLVIFWGVLFGISELVRSEIFRFRTGTRKVLPLQKVRYDIGFRLLIGLELLVAADAVRTLVSPTLEELATLAGIVIIRTIIAYFLSKDISRHDDETV